MRIYWFTALIFFIIGCDSDSAEYPIPEKDQAYEHKVTKERVLILEAGDGEYLKNKAEEMDFIANSRIIRNFNNKNYTPKVFYDPKNDDEKCVCCYKIITVERVEWEFYIIPLEEFSQNYTRLKIDSLKNNEEF